MSAQSLDEVSYKIIEVEQEDDGRWVAEVINLPGVIVYGNSPEHAIAEVEALAWRRLKLKFSVA